jgi:hypothetical protein
LLINNVAGGIKTFVDDLRASDIDEETAWRIARQVASRLQYLGIQDAPRKQRPPTRKAGARAGAILSTEDNKITQTVSQEKRDEGRAHVEELSEQLSGPPDSKFSYKRLEQIRGFLCHLSMTFEVITLFLKGFHLTLCSHLSSRDDDGWKLPDGAFLAYIHEKRDLGLVMEEEARASLNPPDYADIPIPEKVIPVSPFRDNVFALKELLSSEKPPLVTVRANSVYKVVYGFGDASEKGFGSTMLSPGGIKYRIGLWGADDEGESSNWKEFENQVEALEQEADDGNLANAMVFFFTDNSTVESCLYKGNSSSPKLFRLMVCMQKLEMTHNARIVVSHVSGKWMIKGGTDGVCRGQLREGVTAGEAMLSCIPSYEDPLDRAPRLKFWIQSWTGESAEFPSLEGWFERGRDHRGGSEDAKGLWGPRIVKGTFVWTLPPGVAERAIEEIRKARLKHQRSTHNVVCPRLMTPEWMKQLYKVSGLVLSVPAVMADYWPDDTCEPLILGLVLPFIDRNPWQLRSTPKMFAMARKMRDLFATKDVAAGNILRKFLFECKRYEPCRTMWYRECCTLSTGVEFHIRALGDEPGQNEKTKDVARIQKAWGKKSKKGGLHQG